MEDYKYKVRVSCITYNHASYIEDAMNGFCMQETSFPFVCTIVDDASTDGEKEVIQEYLNEHFVLTGKDVCQCDETEDYVRVFTRHKTNINCYFVVVFLKYNHYSIKKPKYPYYKDWINTKYIAICEGDDYWTDSLKLQKQVDFLETHPDYSMCFHGAIIKCESDFFSENRKHQFDGLETREYKGEELIKKWIIPTASMVYRSSIVPPQDPRFLVGDLVLRNQCSIEGRVYCFSEQMSVYRLNDGGMTKVAPWKNIEKRIDHAEALIEHFPPYKVFYKELLNKDLKRLLFSRNVFRLLSIIIKKPRLLKYLF